MQWEWVIRMWKKWRGCQQVPILHGVSREHYAMHATQLLIDWWGVPHAHIECAAGKGHTPQKKCHFWIDCKIFSEGRFLRVLAGYCVHSVALFYCVTNFSLVWTWNKVAVVEKAKKCRLYPTLPYIKYIANILRKHDTFRAKRRFQKPISSTKFSGAAFG